MCWKVLLSTILFVLTIPCYAQNYGLTCFNCTRISRLVDCKTVARCADGETCYIERVLQGDSSSYALWNLGCKPNQQCSVTRTDNRVTCTKCCNGTLCNQEGCGVRGVGSPRGPFCYTCTNMETPQGCNKVELCHKDEVCTIASIAQDAALTNISYTGACVMKQACPAAFFAPNSVVVGKRRESDHNRENSAMASKEKRVSTDLCIRCCTTDVCNDMECPYTPVTPLPSTMRPRPQGWSAWVTWSECTVSCGGGSRFRVRTCADTDAVTKLITCSGSNVDIGTCSTVSCSDTTPVHGGWGAWGQWSHCPFSCGKTGIQHRFRHCDSPAPSHGGSPCSGKSYDSQICNRGPCCTGPPGTFHVSPDVNAKIGETIILHCNATGHYTQIYWEGPMVVGHSFPDNVAVYEGGYTLVVSRLRQENIGLYRCNIRNECGQTSRDVIISSTK